MQYQDKSWVRTFYDLWVPATSHLQKKDQKQEKGQYWRNYWSRKGLPWRTEPEIDENRQRYLRERLNILPNVEEHFYPFRGIALTRADIEWLLLIQQQEQEKRERDCQQQQSSQGLDLRGANLSHINLSALPLVGIQGGLDESWWNKTSMLSFEAAAIHLEGACLDDVHLERAILRSAHLEGAALQRAHLEGAYLARAHLEGTDSYKAHFEGKKMPFEDWKYLRQWKRDLPKTLPAADLKSAFFDRESTLRDATFSDEHLLYGFVSVVDIRWNGVNLAILQWPQREKMKALLLGDELEASRKITWQGRVKKKEERLADYHVATRAYRQFATELESQGLKEEAEQFAYRAQVMQRKVLWWYLRQDREKEHVHSIVLESWVVMPWSYLFSWLLALLTGYGYRPGRSLVSYGSVVITFALLYLHISQGTSHPLTWLDALIFSVSNMVGRGFFRQDIPSYFSDPYSAWSVVEGMIGVFMDILLISTLTQRLFKK